MEERAECSEPLALKKCQTLQLQVLIVPFFVFHPLAGRCNAKRAEKHSFQSNVAAMKCWGLFLIRTHEDYHFLIFYFECQKKLPLLCFS